MRPQPREPQPLLGHFWRSPALRVALVLGIGGAGFAVGNLLLARVLSTPQYALFALVLGLIQIGVPLGPAGADFIVNRYRLDPDRRLLLRSIATSSLTGAGVLAISASLYEFPASLGLLLVACVCAGGANRTGAAVYQSRGRFRPSLLLSQSQNYVIALAATATWALGAGGAWFPIGLLACGYAISAAIGWTRLFSEAPTAPAGARAFPWREGLSISGISAALLLLYQLERLVIPKTLSIEDLATFGVLASVAGSPFRMLQSGVGYTLLPRLRAADSVRARRHLLVSEGRVALAVVIAACAVVWGVAPLLVEWFVAGKYALSPSLIAAALVAGVAKVGSGFASASASALGSPADLRRLSAFSWLSVGLACVGAVLGSRFGLAGVIYGAALGWISYGLSAALLARRHFRLGPESSA